MSKLSHSGISFILQLPVWGLIPKWGTLLAQWWLLLSQSSESVSEWVSEWVSECVVHCVVSFPIKCALVNTSWSYYMSFTFLPNFICLVKIWSHDMPYYSQFLLLLLVLFLLLMYTHYFSVAEGKQPLSISVTFRSVSLVCVWFLTSSAREWQASASCAYRLCHIILVGFSLQLQKKQLL